MHTEFTRDWKLSDNEYTVMKELFDKNCSEKRELENIRKEVASMDATVADILEHKEDDTWREAIWILLQGRNFLARYVGDEELPIPEECFVGIEQETAPEAPIEQRFVAIFSRSQPFSARTMVQVLKTTLGQDVRVKGFEKMRDLLEAIVGGDICGVMCLHGHEQGSILGWMRHDLKVLPGYSYESSLQYVFPPCSDLTVPYPLGEVIPVVQRMLSGAVEDETDFDLREALPVLRARMKVPARVVKIVVVDDEEQMVTGMRTILDAWPSVETEVIVVQKDVEPSIAVGTDIILLDECLGKSLTGTKVYNTLLLIGFTGIVASTSGGSIPEFTKRHFQRKSVIVTDLHSAMDFVTFINSLLL